MRLVHVLPTVHPSYGGPVENVGQLASFLSKHRGVDVEVVACTDSPNAPWFKDFPVRVHGMGPAYGDYGYSPRLVPWLRTHAHRYDVWVINGLWGYYAYASGKVAREMGRPYFVYAHGMLDPWSRRRHPLKYVKKLSYWTLFEQRTLRGAQAVCFTADEEARLASDYFPFGRWESFTVGAGVADRPGRSMELERRILESHPELAGKRIWLFLGRLHPKKGIDLLLRAFSAVMRESYDLHLLIIGEGDPAYTAQLKRLGETLAIAKRVTFSGPLYGSDKWAAFDLAELFILPSHQENFGIAIVEALASGVPVCISNKVNIWREIESLGGGLVCSDCVGDLVHTLRGWLRLAQAERGEYRTRALSCFRARFHVASAADRLLARARESLA